jgi:iron(III) transport system ATP-binding protein
VASVELRGLTKRYGDLAVVDNVSLTIDHGRLVCLLGPSGCGKTTTLRVVAGFVTPDGGEVRVGERLLSSPRAVVPPERRRMAMIFQSYALWPHMTVARNVGYGLRFKDVARADRDARRQPCVESHTCHHHGQNRHPAYNALNDANRKDRPTNSPDTGPFPVMSVVHHGIL